jgi:protein-L-isoaspartate(D-aspartate) O-methyltransferase
MVIPVGAENRVQELMVLEKQVDGSITKRSVTAVRFVPLTRER